MSNETGGYGDVLRVRGVQPFLWMQFLNAFNDNVYKLVVSMLAVVVAGGKENAGGYLAWAGFVFILPFLLFSGYAGQLADRFEKRSVVIFTKAIEIVAMLLAFGALMSGRMEWMLAVLFFTATQAAFFSPAKYGIVPELVETKELARANGLLEMSTFVAIILGTVAGTVLVAEWKHRLELIGFVLIGIAVLGTLASFRIARTPAPQEKRPFVWNPFGDVVSGLKRVAGDRVLMLTVLGTTFFWFLGALFQLVLLLFAKERLHATEDQAGILLMSLALGIGVGSMLAGRLSGEKIELGLVPVGAAGMAVAAFGVAFGGTSTVSASLWLAVLGLAGGLFIVPLNAVLQHRPSEDEKGRLLATANFVNTLGIMLASGVLALLHQAMHFSAATVIGVSAGCTLAATIYTLWLMPDLAARFLLYLLTNLIYRIRIAGEKNVPGEGGALLVANHVSYIDGFLIGSCVQRIVRFLVTEEYYDRFLPIFRLFRAIRVPAGNRRAVLKAIELARTALAEGDIVCIFAEGALTQNGNIGEFHRGLEKIVDGLDVPVIPVHLGGVWGSIFSLDRRASIWRSLRRLPFPISVTFGEPMKQPAAFEVRQQVAELGADAARFAIEERDTLARRFVRTARKNWNRRAVMDSTGRELTYGRTLTAARLLARYVEREWTGEQMIGVMLPASVGAAVANLGIVLAGRVPVNLNFTIAKDSVDSAIAQCGLKTIVTSKQFLAKGKIGARPEMVFLEEISSFSGVEKLRAVLAARLLPVGVLVDRKAKADDLAAVLFSSGSTNKPKGILLSHRNLMANTEAVNALFQIDTADTIAGVLPLFHSFGFTYTLWFPLLHGASAAYHPQPLDAKGLGELVAKSKATLLPAPPTFCQAYVRACSKEQFASLKYVLVGAEKLSATLAQAFREKFGLELLEGYGATEMSPVISVNVPDRERAGVKQTGFRAGSVGQPLPGVAARVVDRDNGETLPCGAEGLLLVKGANRMLGYLDRPEETAAVLHDGWYVTGDIAKLDSEGFIYLVDRQSRFSKIGGEMVPHGKVEEVLQSVVAPAACAVTSIADERRGERLVAFVADPDAKPREIWQALLNSGLAKLWTPKAEDIHAIERLPMLGTGKADLRAMKQLALRFAAECSGGGRENGAEVA